MGAVSPIESSTFISVGRESREARVRDGFQKRHSHGVLVNPRGKHCFRQGDGDGLFAEWRGRIEDEQQPFVT